MPGAGRTSKNSPRPARNIRRKPNLSDTSGKTTPDSFSGPALRREPGSAGGGTPLKLLVFAHTPPPHHGQSYMVQLMIEGFGGDARRSERDAGNPHGIECHHVNAQLSRSLDDVGSFRPWKLFSVLRYCIEAVGCRFRYGVTTLYYIPAPGKLSALLRDWMVLGLCRPFFPRLVLHWHAAGLGEWLEQRRGTVTAWITRQLLGNADTAIVPSRFNSADAGRLRPRHVAVVPNGLPDPCPDYETRVAPQQAARRNRRLGLLKARADTRQMGGPDTGTETVNVLFLAHCTREKGLFDALEAVARVNDSLKQRGAPVSCVLHVAGSFVNAGEREEFDGILRRPEWVGRCRYLGFVSDEAKARAFEEADVFLFPTFYPAESFGLVLVEAMAFGLPIVTTRWRAIPELFPADHPGLVEPRDAAAAARCLESFVAGDTPAPLRAHFLKHYSIEAHLKHLAAALRADHA